MWIVAEEVSKTGEKVKLIIIQMREVANTQNPLSRKRKIYFQITQTSPCWGS
jgi:hypothetical protein